MSGTIKPAPKMPSAYLKDGLTALHLRGYYGTQAMDLIGHLADTIQKNEQTHKPSMTMAAVLALTVRPLTGCIRPPTDKVAIAFGCSPTNLGKRMNDLSPTIEAWVKKAAKVSR